MYNVINVIINLFYLLILLEKLERFQRLQNILEKIFGCQKTYVFKIFSLCNYYITMHEVRRIFKINFFKMKLYVPDLNVITSTGKYSSSY